jgi:hypothetical protein
MCKIIWHIIIIRSGTAKRQAVLKNTAVFARFARPEGGAQDKNGRRRRGDTENAQKMNKGCDFSAFFGMDQAESLKKTAEQAAFLTLAVKETVMNFFQQKRGKFENLVFSYGTFQNARVTIPMIARLRWRA